MNKTQDKSPSLGLAPNDLLLKILKKLCILIGVHFENVDRQPELVGGMSRLLMLWSVASRFLNIIINRLITDHCHCHHKKMLVCSTYHTINDTVSCLSHRHKVCT